VDEVAEEGVVVEGFCEDLGGWEEVGVCCWTGGHFSNCKSSCLAFIFGAEGIGFSRYDYTDRVNRIDVASSKSIHTYGMVWWVVKMPISESESESESD
jgi:hypothetical protein